MSSKGAARRRFTKAGVGVGGGVLLTLASRPGMACDVCVTTSGFQSVTNASHANNTGVICNGRVPSVWAGSNCPSWPASPDTKIALKDYAFTNLFPSSKSCYKITETTTTTVDVPAQYPWQKPTTKQVTTTTTRALTMLEVCSGKADGADGGLAKYIVATYLNTHCSPVRTNYIPMATLSAMFGGCDGGAGFKPSPVSAELWYTTKTLAYMQGTMY